MKKTTVNMFVLCIFVKTLCASDRVVVSDLQSPANEGFVIIDNHNEVNADLIDALQNEDHNEQQSKSPELESLTIAAPINHLVVDSPKNKERNQQNGVTVKKYKHAAAGMLLGGSLAALMHDYYGTNGALVFSLATSAAYVGAKQLEQAVFTEYHIEIFSPEARYLASGFIFGAQLPLANSLLFRNRK